MKVEIFSHTGDINEPRLTCTWTLNAQRNAVADSPIAQVNMEKHGLRVGVETFYPNDGEIFLRNLPSKYANSTWGSAEFTE